MSWQESALASLAQLEKNAVSFSSFIPIACCAPESGTFLMQLAMCFPRLKYILTNIFLTCQINSQK